MDSRLQVSILKEDATKADRIADDLRRAGYDACCTCVDNEEAYRTHLDPQQDLILADHSSKLDSRRAIDILKEAGAVGPFMVISLQGKEGAVLEALRHVLEENHQGSREGNHQVELRLQQRAISACSQGIAIIDACQPDYPVIFVNPGFEKLSGYRREEIIGRPLRVLNGPRTDPTTVANLEKALQKAEAGSFEILNYRKDGTIFWNALTLSPVRDETGRLTHFAIVQTDISERKRVEVQYRQVQKMEAIGRLAGGIAHDFNNLLTVILGCSDLALTALPRDSAIREHLQQIKQAGERGANLTNQLLAFSRKQRLEPRLVYLNEIISDISKMLRRLIGENIEYVTALDTTLGMVKADPSQLEQVILNLVVNSRDAMPDGGRITVETRNVQLDDNFAREHPEVTPGSYVMMAIRDTGCGMTPEVMAHMYEPFFTTKEGRRGTGLGLATVYGVVKQSNGYIYVDSQPGEGTAFSVYLPLVRSTEVAAPLLTTQPVFPNGKETLLLVEDDDNVRRLNSCVLTSKGYRVLEAGDGEAALKICREHPGTIHMVITDVIMPKMNCRELVEGITRLRPKAKILYVSGYSIDVIIDQGIADTDISVLQKPFQPFNLIRKVREMLKS